MISPAPSTSTEFGHQGAMGSLRLRRLFAAGREPVIHLALGFAIVCFAGLGVYNYRHAIDQVRERQYARDLRQLHTLNAQLNEAVLKSRAELVAHYDELSSIAALIKAGTERLSRPPDFLRSSAVISVTASAAKLRSLIHHKADLLEDFKYQNAITRNAKSMVPVVAHQFFEASRKRANRSLPEDQSMLLLLLDTAHFQGHSVDDAELLRKLKLNLALAAGPEQQRSTLTRHLELLLQSRPRLDKLVQEILTTPVTIRAAELEDIYGAEYRAALRASNQRDWAMFILSSVIIVLSAVAVLLRLQRSSSALRRVTNKLRIANRSLRQEQRRERELTHLKSQFVSMTSHEFRTPLSAIQSSAELLQSYGEHWPEDRRNSHLQRIADEVRNMTQLLDEILLVGRAEAGILRPTLSPLDLRSFVSALVDTLCRSWSKECNVALSFDGPSEIESDERLLRHLLTNLLENAVKYSEPGTPIALVVRTEPSCLRMEVSDRGIGIPAEDIAHLFTSFRRGSNVGQIRGTGLGLAVVHHIVKTLGGEIAVESQEGCGSRFSLVLPRVHGQSSIEARVQ